MRHLLIFVLFFDFLSVCAQETVIRLWEDKAPGSENWLQVEKRFNTNGGLVIQNVVDPTMSVFIPDKENRTDVAVIVCPGGGFRSLSWDSEGVRVAKWLNSKGITAFVLKYRIMNTDKQEPKPSDGQKAIIKSFNSLSDVVNANVNPSPDNQELKSVIDMAVSDAKRAFLMVKQDSVKWGIDPKKLGYLGFSAGGGVAIGVSIDSNCRPGFVATAYGPALTDIVEPRNAPPLFMAVASDHKNVAVGCLALYLTWKSVGNSAELHLFGKGKYPFGINKNNMPSDEWPEMFYRWLISEVN
jgi:hypothetical protein